MLFAAFFSVFSCADDEGLPNPEYDRGSFLNFDKAAESNYFVSVGSTYRDVELSFGTIGSVDGSHQVKLVVDAAKSTAVEGVNFQIVQNPVELAAGQNGGTFKIRILETGATTVPKVAVFKLQSATLPNAVFNQEHKMSMSLTCPVSYFIGTGTFKNTVAYWMAPAGTNYIVENVTTGTTPQFKIKGYMDDGSDLVVNYNPTTYEVNIPLQPTGYAIPQGNVYASDHATTKSSFNPCTRTLNLNVYWHVRNAAGTIVAHYNGGNAANEVFVGQ
ncbi:hypothetical protein CHRYSEOSP005_04140 [Chryseobacterium sp. Alg-005]